MFLRGEVVGGGLFRVGGGRLVIRLPDGWRRAEGGVEVPDEAVESDPWLRVAGEVHDKDYDVPVVEGGRITVVGPVVVLDDGSFLGYKVVADERGRFLDVLDAGKYRRVVAPDLEEYVNVLPVVRVAGAGELSEEEARVLAANTPAPLIPLLLRKSGVLRRLGELAAAEKLRRDPLSLLDLPAGELEEVVRVAARYWREATPETSPAVVEVLLAELRARAPNATPELQYLLERLREERREEELLEAARVRHTQTLGEYMARIAEERARERARQRAREIRRLLAEQGVALTIRWGRERVPAG